MSTSIREQCKQNGFVVLHELFTREEALLLKQEAGNILEVQGRNRTGVNLGLAAAGDLFKHAAAHPRLVAALQEIIGESVMFLNDKLVYKDAGTDFGSPWHQDYPYWYGSHKYSVWIALDDATPHNGCLRVVPGSHLTEAVHRGKGASNDNAPGFTHRLTEQEIDPEQVIDLSVSRGDAVIFHDLLYHSSYPNSSGQDRWALISTYKDGTQQDPHYDWAGAAFAVGG